MSKFRIHQLLWPTVNSVYDWPVLRVFSSTQAALRTLLSGVIVFMGYYHWQKWCPCKRSRSKVKVTEPKTSFVPIWAFLDCNSCLTSQIATKWCTKLAVALLFFLGNPWNFKGHAGEISTILTLLQRFRTLTPLWIDQWLWNDAQSLK